MKKFLVLLISTHVLAFSAGAQPTQDGNATYSGITILLGPSANYFQGRYIDRFDVFDSDLINFQLNSFLGYISPRYGGRNSVGIFASAGYTNQATFIRIQEEQNLDSEPIDINKYFTFFQVEPGMIFSNVLRLSTGYGRQNYKTVAGYESYSYFSSTAGLMINLGAVYWNIDTNILYGMDYPRTSFRFSSGFMVKF
jgi:hypothetical protein